MKWAVIYVIGICLTYVIKKYFERFEVIHIPIEDDNGDNAFYGNIGMILFYGLWPIILPLIMLISSRSLIRFIRIKLGISEYD